MIPQEPAVIIGLSACAVALLIVGYLLAGPRPARLSMDRRRPDVDPGPSRLAGAATAATARVDDMLRKRGSNGVATLLELAGVKTRPQDLVLLTVIAAVVAGGLGTVLVNPLVGILLAILVPIGVRVRLGMLVSKRQKVFADQLDDSLQLMASSLRAGHSLMQALASVAKESEEPASEEFSRIINETRVGRELSHSLTDSARRMGSEDFIWVTQAIQINREVGGNLAEVLDRVGETIRERNQIRRQVKALSAEGRLSALVLMLLPVCTGGFLALVRPEYIGKFTQSLVGWALLVLAAILMAVGYFWLRKSVRIKF